MASAITLEGIDQAISNLKYKNKKTLKYKFIQHIRQYYTIENAVVSLNEIDHEALIKMLWDTDHSPEAIKNKRKNLNNVRSSVNSDLKKLHEKGENPQGIKIGPKNIFVMSEDAKDKILKEFGYDLQPDGTLKLDQIMDILKLANETVASSMAVEDTMREDGISKIDQLKNLIKGLFEKIDLSSHELSKDAVENSDMVGKGDEKGAGFEEPVEVIDEGLLDEVDEVEEFADLDDELAYIDEVDEEDIYDDAEDLETGEISDVHTYDVFETDENLDDLKDEGIDNITDSGIDEIDELSEIRDDMEEVLDEEEVELDDVEEVDEIGEVLESEDLGEETGGSGSGGEGTLANIGFEQSSGKEKAGINNVGNETLSGNSTAEYEDDDKGGSIDVGHNMAGNPEYGFDEQGGQKEDEQLGLPVGSLGQEYNVESDSKIKKNKLLAEEFDGYLGSMDRYYNQYILIPDGEYLIGSKHPQKDEKTEQAVYLEPFYFGRFPITNGLFEIFVEKTGYKTTAEKIGYGTVYYGRFEKKKDEKTGLITSKWNSSLYYKRVKGACWYRPSGPKSTLYNKRNHPVVQISMDDAMAFAAWTGKRLPTENEWEAASRTEKGWMFPWGLEWKKDTCNIEESCAADTTPVDKYIEFENDYGIVDTLGNVLEWIDNGIEEMSKTNHGKKYGVVKGGSWISGNEIKLSSRFIIEPESHSNILGFRLVAY